MKYAQNNHLSEKNQKALGVYSSKGGAIDRNTGSVTATSIFDPVLCELMYQWFCTPKGNVLDPFAGGSVRGIVASKLGYKYTGIDLSSEQIKNNISQAKKITPELLPKWVVGDSREMVPKTSGQFDFVFSCPPYGDLEIYSDLDNDLSNMGYEDFKDAYWDIIAHCFEKLENDRFACFVVGDFRDKKGNYRNFVSHTIEGFLRAGFYLYNEAIFLTPLGSLPVRAGHQFKSGRKLGKAHQNVLIFVKGCGKKAAQVCGSNFEIPELN